MSQAEIIFAGDGSYITNNCPMCGRKHIFEVTTSDAVKWQQGMHVQNAFPYLNVDQREAIISGYCVPCWDKIMGD